MAMAAPTARLRRALQREVSAVAFDEAIVVHFAQSLEDGQTLEEEEVVDAWSPILLDLVPALAEDGARGLCLRILQRFQSSEPEEGLTPSTSTGSAGELAAPQPDTALVGRADPKRNATPPREELAEDIQGLSEWLERLQLAQYEPAARDWCKRMGAADIDEVLEEWQDFCEELKLKPLQRKRVQRDVESTMGRGDGQRSGSFSCDPATFATQGALSSQSTPVTGPEPVPAAVDMAAVGALQLAGRHEHSELPYQLLEELGKGATATVYKCAPRDAPGAFFAAKAISLSKLRRRSDLASQLEKLHRETNILLSLKHPNVVGLHDVHETEDWLFLVMELVEGGELFDYIVKHERLREPEARFVFLQLIDALRYIHSKGVVHRDLKPDNILIDSGGSCEGRLHVKISDFGHSKLVDDGWAVAQTQVGTPHYWAPEVTDPRRGNQGYDERVDLWSLGVVLYVMIEGTYPFDDATAPRHCGQGHTPPIQFKRDSSELATDLVLGLIQVRPEDRLTLDVCSRHSWVQADSGPLARLLQALPSGSATASREAEERFQLRGKPPELERLRSDLHQFTCKYMSSAMPVARGEVCEVVITWADLEASVKVEAREELKKLLEFHAPKQPPTPSAGLCAKVPSRERYFSSDGRDGEKREGDRKKLLTNVVLHVSEVDGAGLDLRAEKRGMRVLKVLDRPGQPNIMTGDLIANINQVSLGSLCDEEQVEEAFAANFHHGAMLSIWRRTK